MSAKVYEVVTERILAKLQEGTVPWRKPWSGSHARLGQHRNGTSKRPYSGINALLTGMSGFGSPDWYTFKQVQELGGRVRKGERGTPIVFWRQIEVESGEDKKKVPFLRYYTAFNADQVDGLPASGSDAAPVIDFEPIRECERIVEGYQGRPPVEHREQRAYYRPSTDAVNMPRPETFASREEYYSTLFHELVHSTGHESRLNRDTIAKVNLFGSHQYSKEELIAEMGAAFLCGRTGIETRTLDNSASYIASWLAVLKGDPKFVIQAAAKAQKAVDYILGTQEVAS